MNAAASGTSTWLAEKAGLEMERNGLRAGLAAARGTVLDLRSHLSDLRAGQDFLRLCGETAAADSQAARTATAATAELAAMRAERDWQRGVQDAQRADLAAVRAERDWLCGIRDAHEARLRELEPIARQAGALATERDTLARRLGSLDRLARELRWDDGPRAVRAVLPFARLMRRMRGG